MHSTLFFRVFSFVYLSFLYMGEFCLPNHPSRDVYWPPTPSFGGLPSTTRLPTSRVPSMQICRPLFRGTQKAEMGRILERHVHAVVSFRIQTGLVINGRSRTLEPQSHRPRALQAHDARRAVSVFGLSFEVPENLLSTRIPQRYDSALSECHSRLVLQAFPVSISRPVHRDIRSCGERGRLGSDPLWFPHPAVTLPIGNI